MPHGITLETVEPGVSRITLDRAGTLNALTFPLVEELHGRLARVARDRATRVLLLTGANGAFCSGLDLAELGAVADEAPERTLAKQELVGSLATALRSLPQPVVAAVDGVAVGGGLALALACDIRVLSDRARLGVGFVRIGLSGCDVGTSYLLPRIVGAGVAAELMLTGREVAGEEALRIGLASRLVPAGALEEEALALARAILRNSPFGVEMTKAVLRSSLDAPSLEAAIAVENRTQVLATRTAGFAEALGALRERREPRLDDG